MKASYEKLLGDNNQLQNHFMYSAIVFDHAVHYSLSFPAMNNTYYDESHQETIDNQ